MTTSAIFVHGHARIVRGGPGEADALRHYWTEIYDSSPEDWVSSADDARYVEIVRDVDVLLRLLARTFRGAVRAMSDGVDEVSVVSGARIAFWRRCT